MSSIGFRGAAYANKNTATNDLQRRMETAECKLTKAIVQVGVYGQNFGLYYAYPVYYPAGASFELLNIDISTLYFINNVPGSNSNGSVSMMGVYAD